MEIRILNQDLKLKRICLLVIPLVIPYQAADANEDKLMTSLPEDIEARIISYLNAEYGAHINSELLTPEDLTYEGEYEQGEGKTWYWKYPCSQKSGCWATVIAYEDGYLISMTDASPR